MRACDYRCSIAEQQLAALRDLEEDEPIIGFDYSGGGGPEGSAGGLVSPDTNAYSSGSSSNTSSGGLQRRGAGVGSAGVAARSAGGYLHRGGSRVITDLEKFGVKPGEGVSRAVNAIDSWTLFVGRYSMLCCVIIGLLHFRSVFFYFTSEDRNFPLRARSCNCSIYICSLMH